MPVYKHHSEAISDRIHDIRTQMGFTVVLGEPIHYDERHPNLMARHVYFHPHTELLEIVTRRLVPKASNNRMLVVWQVQSTGELKYRFFNRLVYLEGGKKEVEYYTDEEKHTFVFFRYQESPHILLCYPHAVFAMPHDGSIAQLPPTHELYRDP